MVRERSFLLKLLLAFIMSVQISGDRKPNWKRLKKNLKCVDSHSWKVSGAQLDSGARVDGVIRNHSSDWFLSPACLPCFQVSSHLMGTKRLSEALSFHSTPPSPVGNRILLSCRLPHPKVPELTQTRQKQSISRTLSFTPCFSIVFLATVSLVHLFLAYLWPEVQDTIYAELGSTNWNETWVRIHVHRLSSCIPRNLAEIYWY